MVIPRPSRPRPYSGPRLYEFCIAVALKQRRFTEAHCAWVGGVSLAEMNSKSLTAGRKVTTEVTAWGGPPTPTSTTGKITAAATAAQRMTERVDVPAMFSRPPLESLSRRTRQGNNAVKSYGSLYPGELGVNGLFSTLYT